MKQPTCTRRTRPFLIGLAVLAYIVMMTAGLIWAIETKPNDTAPSQQTTTSAHQAAAPEPKPSGIILLVVGLTLGMAIALLFAMTRKSDRLHSSFTCPEPALVLNPFGMVRICPHKAE